MAQTVVNICLDLERNDYTFAKNTRSNLLYKVANDDLLNGDGDGNGRENEEEESSSISSSSSSIITSSSSSAVEKFAKFFSFDKKKYSQEETKKYRRPDNSSTTNTNTNTKHISEYFNINSTNNCFKFLWIKIALLNKCLIPLVELIVDQASKHYVSSALVAEPSNASLLLDLLIVSSTAIDFTRSKSNNFFYSKNNDGNIAGAASAAVFEQRRSVRN